MSEDAPTAGRQDSDEHAPERTVSANSDGVREQGFALELRVVEYPDRPDRCTLCPPGLSGIERMETWLSANRGAFVDLGSWR